MDQEIQAEYDRLRDEGMSAAEAAQQARYNVTRLAELAELRAEPPTPTPQPPQLQFGNKRIHLPPMAGGALDALVAFGLSTGIPQMVSQDSRDAEAELRERSPGGYRAAQAASLAASLGIGALAGTRAVAAARAPLVDRTVHGFAPVAVQAAQNAPSLAGRGASLAQQILRNRALPWLVGATGGGYGLLSRGN